MTYIYVVRVQVVRVFLESCVDRLTVRLTFQEEIITSSRKRYKTLLVVFGEKVINRLKFVITRKHNMIKCTR